MTTTRPEDGSKSFGVRQQALLVLMADGLARSALDVEDEGIGLTEGQARATFRSLEKRSLLDAKGFTVGSVRRSFQLTDAGMAAALGLMCD